MNPKDKKIILLVEDEAFLALRQKQYLETKGFEVHHLRRGRDAVSYITDRKPADLVLMDIALGDGVSGADAAREILSIRKLPLIFLSSHTEEHILEWTDGIDASGYVARESGDAVLLASIRMAFRLFESQQRELAHQRALGESEQRMREFFEDVSEVLPLSFAIVTPQGKVLFANRHALQLFGIKSRDELEELHVPLVWADPEKRKEWVRMLTEQGSARNIETEMIGPDGRRLWLLASGMIINYQGQQAILSIHNDISDRKAAEDEVIESERWFRTLANTTATGIFIYQGEKFVYANDAITRITGYSHEEFLALSHLREIAHPDHRKLAEARARDRQAGKPVPEIYELKILRKDGESRWVEVSGGVIDWKGKPAAIGTAFDITKRKLAYEQVRSLLEEKELILKETHHRVKNNMNVISGLLSLQAGEMEESDCGKILQDAAGRAQSMTVLYDKLYRAEETGWITLDQFLKPLVTEIMEPFYSSCPIETRIEVEAIPMHAKTLSSLGIIINEMVTNSMKYAFRGRKKGEITVTAGKRGELIHICYRDDGVGLPEDTDFSQGQTFGMQLIRLLTEQLSGTLEVRTGSAIGGGTELDISFPPPDEADRG